MLGSIIGDIIGSTREGRKSIFNNDGLIEATEKNSTITPLTKPEPILHDGLSFTDDTVLMLATDKALREGCHEWAPFAKHYAAFFDMHSEPGEFYRGQGIGYGMMFMEWAQSRLQGEDRGGYQSYGNGSAMRISPVAYRLDPMVTMLNVARASAWCTHNHPQGIEGAQMVALALWAARHGATPSEIKALVEQNSTYHLDFEEDQLIRHYFFQPTCQGSVPQALWAALEGPDFESVMRRCLRIGGDTDTVACMAGGLAELLYGIPPAMAAQALAILKRDGPYLFDEYQAALASCTTYPNYTVTEASGVKTVQTGLRGWASRIINRYRGSAPRSNL